MQIDPRAAVAPGAKIGQNVSVAPFAVIDDNVVIGNDCVIGPHVHIAGNAASGAKIGDHVTIAASAVIDQDVVIGNDCVIGPNVHITGCTTIGDHSTIHNGANIGDAPQDLHYNNEKSFVDIGKNCVIREYVTIHRGTEENSHTIVGDNCLLMAFSHLGHNTVLGNGVVVANASLLAGRVEVGDNAFISANVMVHQFVRIGRLAMIGGGNAITQDIPPFCLLQWDQIQGPNIVGLRRAGWNELTRNTVRNAIKTYFFENLSRINAIDKIKQELQMLPEIQEFIDFVMDTKRGIAPGHNSKPHHRADQE